MAAAAQTYLHRIFRQLSGHLQMRENFRGRMREQIASRKSFQKIVQAFANFLCERAEVRHHFVVRVHMQTLIEAAVQVIGGGDVKLPDIFCFPGSERFGIDGFDVRVGQQAKHFQALGSFHFFGKRANCFGIKNVAAQCGAHFQMAPDEKKNRFAVGLVEIEAAMALSAISTLART